MTESTSSRHPIAYLRETLGESKLTFRLNELGSEGWILADRYSYRSNSDSLGQTDYTFHDCIFWRPSFP